MKGLFKMELWEISEIKGKIFDKLDYIENNNINSSVNMAKIEKFINDLISESNKN